jgi:hypothetical protein
MHGGCPRLPPGLEWATRDTGLVDPRRAGVRGESHLLALPGGLAGPSVSGSQSESLPKYPACTSGGFGNSGTSEKGDKPSGSTDHPRPERPIVLAVDQQFGEGPALRVASELTDPVCSLEVGQHGDVE